MRDRRSPTASFIDGFLGAKGLSAKSKDDYERYLRHFDVFTGKTSLEMALTLDNATKWVEEQKTRGTFAARNGAMYLKSFASWITKARYIVLPGGSSPLVGLEAPKTPRSERTAFSDEDVARIAEALSYRPNRDRVRAIAYFRLFEGTGVRQTEGCLLALQDVSLDHDHKRGYVRVRAATSKGNRDRLVRFGKDAYMALNVYISEVRPTYHDRVKPEPLFLTEAGKAFNPNGFATWTGRIWDDIEAATGIKGSSHWLRHLWATTYNRGMQFTGNNVYDLRREGGWADLSIPLRYTHERPEGELIEMPVPGDAIRQRKAV